MKRLLRKQGRRKPPTKKRRRRLTVGLFFLSLFSPPLSSMMDEPKEATGAREKDGWNSPKAKRK